MAKNYKSFTGLKEFYYGELDESDNKISGEEAERVEFLQEISVGVPQEIEKAYGDNTVAEIAVSTDSISLNTTFHTIPIEDRATIYGWGGDEEEGYYLPESPNPPYVACMFSRTSEDGGSEWLGFPKGKFMMPSMDGSTKQDSDECSNDETEVEFKTMEIDSIDKRTPFIIKKDKPGETKNRDKRYEQPFVVPHPNKSGNDDNGDEGEETP